jgi:hypothetical protein
MSGFERAALQAKQDIDDALGLRLKPLGPVPNQQPMQIPGNPQLTPQGMQFSGSMGPLSGSATVGPQGFGGANVNYSAPLAGGRMNLGAAVDPRMKLAQLQAQYQHGPFSANVQYQPGGGVSGGVQYRQNFEEGGLATSVHMPQDYHERDIDFINTRNQHMREMVGKSAYAMGGLAVK